MTFKTRITILMIHDHVHLTNVNSYIALELKCQSSQILYPPNLLIPTFSIYIYIFFLNYQIIKKEIGEKIEIKSKGYT